MNGQGSTRCLNWHADIALVYEKHDGGGDPPCTLLAQQTFSLDTLYYTSACMLGPFALSFLCVWGSWRKILVNIDVGLLW